MLHEIDDKLVGWDFMFSANNIYVVVIEISCHKYKPRHALGAFTMGNYPCQPVVPCASVACL